MAGVRFVLVGILFGVMFYKAEVVSWFRIQEMFLFQSIHMYGVIGSSVVLAALATWIIRTRSIRDVHGEPVVFPVKERSWPRYALGGTIFGVGWALTGACPGPLFDLVGAGFTVYVVVIASALLGTVAYGALRNRLPH
jgi:uncharacterized membrane protein YedE/YeeE